IKAGASALQLYTGFIYGGPGLVPKILDDLEARLAADGFPALEAAVGSAAGDGDVVPSHE
ncbi:MAG: hypothetical protein ACR2P3_14440, partial [Geminicoccaceae bacterium]